MKLFFLNYLCLMTCFTGRCFAQDKNQDKIDKYVQGIMLERHIPGISIAVIKNGELVKKASYGVANIELNAPVTNETVFEIASMSKQFTCAAILLLQQQGKLSIKEKLSTYLKNLPDSWQDIKLYQLMNHTAGLRDCWEEDTPYFLMNHNDSLMFEQQKKNLLLFKPGESFHYSSGPFTLGLVIAKVSHRPYAQFMKEEIFQPLGMNSTCIYDSRQIVPHKASGYVFEKNILMNGYDISPAAEARGDVGVITTIDDMIKWDQALNDNRLLNRESLQAMFTPGALNDGTHLSYGYGWFVYPSFGGITIEHGGSFRTGFNSDIAHFPKQNISVIVLTNLWQAEASSIARKVASAFSQDLQPASERKLKPDPDVNRTNLLKGFMIKASTKTWTDKELYQQANFCGDNTALLEWALKGFKQMVYVDKLSIATHAMDVFGEEISEIILYRTDADRTSYWSFGFNEKGKLVFVLWEG